MNPPAQETVPYGLTLSVEIRDTKMTQIESPSHAIRTTPHAHGTTVTLASAQAALDRDFVLLMRPEDAHQPVAHVAREADGTLCAMVTFHPQPLGIPSRGNEVLFLLDCSGSMQGDSIAQAQRALALCVRALAPTTLSISCVSAPTLPPCGPPHGPIARPAWRRRRSTSSRSRLTWVALRSWRRSSTSYRWHQIRAPATAPRTDRWRGLERGRGH